VIGVFEAPPEAAIRGALYVAVGMRESFAVGSAPAGADVEMFIAVAHVVIEV